MKSFKISPSIIYEKNKYFLSKYSLKIFNRKGMKLPHGWGADKEGQETDDPNKVLNGGGLLPLGGADESGGYKGILI